MRLFVWCLIAIVALAARPLAAADPYERMLASQKQVTEYLVRQAQKITAAAASEIAFKDSWEPVREQRRTEMLDMLGLHPLPPKTPLNVKITGVIDQGDYTIEKITFESLPKVYVTANLYLPKERAGRLPTVIYVCGHAFSAFGDKTQYQRHPIAFAKHGYVSMIIDSIQIAETFALHHGVLNNEMYDWYSRGYTPAGVEVWNVIRALDYLETRPEVDKERLGITGRSGGAAMSWFAGAVEPRLKVIAPVMGISTYAANVAANTQKLHCDCMFAINNYLHDMMHQGALIAPRALYMMHGRRDALFPVPGYEEFERRIGKLYESYGAREKFKNLVVETGHQDSDLLRGEAVKFFDRHLKGIPEREIDLSFSNLPEKQLAVFDGEPPSSAQNFRVHETFTAGPPMRHYGTQAEWMKRRAELMGTLKEKVFRGLPGTPGSLESKPGSIDAPETFESTAIETEPGISVEALVKKSADPGKPALLYIASDGEDLTAMRDTLRQIWGSKQNAVMIIYPRGVGEVPWPKKFWKDTFRNAMHTGRTIDSMRLWDVMMAAEFLRRRDPAAPIATLGHGVSGLLGMYAALLDERIDQVLLIDPPSSHREGPIFLNVLRDTDLPEAAALLAPRRLSFYGRIPPEYQPTQGIFSLGGNPDHLSLTMSLEAALNGRRHHNFSSGL